MATTIIPKKSSVPSKVPLPSDLQVGELAVNLSDKIIYSKNADGSIISLSGSAGLSESQTPLVDVVLYPPAGTSTLLVEYTVGKEIVYKNGVKLIRNADYIATNGTSIVLANPTLEDDVLQIIVYASYNNIFVQAVQPNFPLGVQSLWIQTGLGTSGSDITFWINI